MLFRSAHKLVAWTPTLHAIISGTASIGFRTCSRMPPATAEKAKPARPETKPPAKAAALSSKKDPMSPMSGPPVGADQVVGRSGGISGGARLLPSSALATAASTALWEARRTGFSFLSDLRWPGRKNRLKQTRRVSSLKPPQLNLPVQAHPPLRPALA